MSIEAQSHTSTDIDHTGRMIAGRYSILRRLGEGGMGVVYAALDTRIEKPVAIKILKEDFAHRQDIVARFTQEAKSAGRIKHENVLDVSDYGGTDEGSFYIVMEMLVGTDLADVLQVDGTIELSRALNIAIQVTRALGAAHAKGIVHRDLKPENIFLLRSEDGREVVKIVDFGIAQMKDLSGAEGGKKLTQTGMIFGTPEYMSPEQAKGASIDHRVDIYAVGIILYEMACGRTPFAGDSFMGILTQHLYEPAPAILTVNPQAHITSEYEAVIAKALAKNPDQRFQSMQELGEDLVRVRDGGRPTAVSAILTAPVRPTGDIGLISSTNTGAFVTNQTVEVSRQKNSRSSLILGIGLGAAVILAGAAIALNASSTSTQTDRGITTTRTPEATSDAAVAQTQTGAADASTVPSVAQPAVSAKVTLRFVTRPAGAQVFLRDGDTPVCAATPCELEVPVGEERVGYAVFRNKRGEFTVTASEAGQVVQIPLAAPRIARTTPQHNTHSTHTTNSGGNSRCTPGQLQFLDPVSQIYRPCPAHR
ncbi:MAG: serine/threonine-protein kinase [Deltaproteobacteria bacterium]|nr:serine/threonine-protein kinase [Deltaproteobacteria bacterium]